MFYFMTKFFMKENKPLFSHTHAVLTDVLSLSLAYSFQLAAFSTALKERFAKLALELVYFAHDNLHELDITSLENVINNRLALHTAQSLKNDKKNEKNQETQRLLTELYISLLSLRSRAEEAKRHQVAIKSKISNYLHSVRKMHQIIVECS